MRLHTLTPMAADALSGGGPLRYTRPARAELPPDEQTVRLQSAVIADALALVEDSMGHPLTDDERRRFAAAVPIVTNQDGTLLIAVGPPPAVPAQQIADGGTVELAAVPSPWDRLRLWSLCAAGILAGVVLGCLGGWLLSTLAEAIGRALG